MFVFVSSAPPGCLRASSVRGRAGLDALRRFFRGVSGAIVVLHSSLSSFVASTRLIRSGVGAIDSSDQSRQAFEQYDTSKVLAKVFQSTF